MVELRWLERIDDPAYVNHQTGLSLPAVTSRVLQYRFAINGIWSDWRDVPTVRGEG